MRLEIECSGSNIGVILFTPLDVLGMGGWGINVKGTLSINSSDPTYKDNLYLINTVGDIVIFTGIKVFN